MSFVSRGHVALSLSEALRNCPALRNISLLLSRDDNDADVPCLIYFLLFQREQIAVVHGASRYLNTCNSTKHRYYPVCFLAPGSESELEGNISSFDVVVKTSVRRSRVRAGFGLQF